MVRKKTMELQNKTGDNDVVQDIVPTDKPKETVYCFYCSELACGYNSDGKPTCGVSVDHPGCDDAIVTPL